MKRIINLSLENVCFQNLYILYLINDEGYHSVSKFSQVRVSFIFYNLFLSIIQNQYFISVTPVSAINLKKLSTNVIEA